ncbi:MAG TPA: hypothetical protein ENH80_11475 [Phycisphaerae bacterium]|nr:hypothetical protein [Phycisphaerae bacterium]HDZ44546.1 hypothetical protein [Phycisphaerae bacterium]
MATLSSAGILDHMQAQLDRDPSHEFAFVTAIPANRLADLCESARNSPSDPEAYYQHQILAIGQTRVKVYEDFCARTGLDSQGVKGRAKAYDYLRRFRIILWPDNQHARDQLFAQAASLVVGQPETIVSSLRWLAENRLHQMLTTHDVRSHLVSNDFAIRKLDHDVRVGPAIAELQSKFADSIRPHLVAGKLIPRSETGQVLAAVENDATVILHGKTGIGKSGVLYELALTLRQQGRPYLPIRLDRQVPQGTPRQFGEAIGLPESPARCLRAVSENGGGVLILDQLDAIRWTSSHSANSLEVCKSLLREVETLRDMGHKMGVVLSCRTFDLENDPDIKAWLSNSPNNQYRKIEVKELDEDDVENVVNDAGGNFGHMAKRQRQILRSPNHLAMWTSIVTDGSAPPFNSGTQLIRAFWDNRYRELARLGVGAADANRVIDTVVDYMEEHGKIAAPVSLVRDYQQELTCLQTCGILQATGPQLSFCHQSYLDFRIADRLLREMHSGNQSVCNWLGDKDSQSLFRREQLRQVLSLLIDESPGEFLSSVKDILRSCAVRFHLKHLVLELLSQLEQPSSSMVAYLKELLEDGYWQQHIIEAVIVGRPWHVGWMIDEQLLPVWLASGDDEEASNALWLLRTVTEDLPDVVTELLEPYIDHDGDWPQRIFGCLGWRVENDSERKFELRLTLARRGLAPGYLHWIGLAASFPERAIRLVEAELSAKEAGQTSARGVEDFQPRRDKLSVDELSELTGAARQCPEFTWDRIMPHVVRLTAGMDEHYGPGREEWLDDGTALLRDGGNTNMARGSIGILAEAGRTLASSDAEQLLARARPLNASTVKVIQEILARSYAALPPEHADEGLEWLMACGERLALGSGFHEHEWTLAERLVTALSPHCSDGVFRRLEGFITHYHQPNEKRMGEHYIRTWKEGYFGDYWGRMQHKLLPCLAPSRRNDQTNGLIGVLARKFEGYAEDRFLRSGGGIGGSVRSPLPQERLETVSDRAWLGIVSNKSIPQERHAAGRWKQVSVGVVAESSLWHFSSDLRRLASRFPERFGQLALQFPEEAHPDYVAAILSGLQKTMPSGVPDEERAQWRPAEVITVEAFLARFLNDNDRGVAMAFCDVLRDRSEADWSDEIIAQLIDYANNHPDPESGQLNVWSADKGRDVAHASPDDLFQTSINCVRGRAALTIGALVWEHPEWLPRFTECLDRLAGDPNPAVRVAAIDACLPVLNIDRDRAVDWFCRICRDDPRVPASPRAIDFFNYCTESHPSQLTPIVQAMMNSPVDDVAQAGAREATARWLFYGLFASELPCCREGTVAQRKGVAKVGSQFLSNPHYTERCWDILQPYLNDPDEDVRHEIWGGFSSAAILESPGIHEMLERYVHSRAYVDSPDALFRAFEDYSGSLVPFATVFMSICQVFCDELRDDTRTPGSRHGASISTLSPLLLRLYEQSAQEEFAAVNRQCLDAWDMLFEKRVGTVRELTRQIEM